MVRKGIARAPLLCGIAGCGVRGLVHTLRVVQLSVDLPVVIGVVDTAEWMARVLPKLVQMVHEGLIIMVDCRIIADRSPGQRGKVAGGTGC